MSFADEAAENGDLVFNNDHEDTDWFNDDSMRLSLVGLAGRLAAMTPKHRAQLAGLEAKAKRQVLIDQLKALTP